MNANPATFARAQVIDWSVAPGGADGWARERGRCFWWRKPAAGELAPVRLGEAPDLMPLGCERVGPRAHWVAAVSAQPSAFSPAIEASPSIRLVLPPPLSANRYWRSFVPRHGARAIVVVSDEAKAYRAEVVALARAAGVRRPIEGRVQLGVQLYPARPQDWARRARKDPDGWADGVRCIDLDNALKVLLDALKGVAMGDDAWVRRIDAERMEPDEHGARVVVTITPIVRQAMAPGLFDER